MSIEDDLLESLEPDPSPAPKPSRPAPEPVKPKLADVVGAPAPAIRRIGEWLLIAFVTAAITTGLVAWKLGGRGDGPKPSDVDTRFVAVGKAYLGDLGAAYGSAWEDGAKILDAGQPIGMALDATAKSWEANRKAAFNQRITPELSKVVQQGKDEKDVTIEDRAALAKAYRGLAKGLSGGK